MQILIGIVLGILLSGAAAELQGTNGAGFAPAAKSLSGSRVPVAVQYDQTGTEYVHGNHCLDERVF